MKKLNGCFIDQQQQQNNTYLIMKKSPVAPMMDLSFLLIEMNHLCSYSSTGYEGKGGIDFGLQLVIALLSNHE